jgi:TnpA family transposase
VATIHETAYPRLKASLTARDLEEVYMPTSEELAQATSLTRNDTTRACFVLLLKTFQRLGYFVYLHDVPAIIVHYIADQLRFTFQPGDLHAYDASGTRRRHVASIRAYLQVQPFDQVAQTVLEQTIWEAAQTKEELADIINVGIEELVRQRFELPGFSTLRRVAQSGRAAVNQDIYRHVADAMGTEGRAQVDQMLRADETTSQTLWNTIKVDPGKPTLTQLRELVARLKWLSTYNHGAMALAVAPSVKVQHFAAEAKSLDAARMQRMTASKRYTLGAALIKVQVAQTLDDLGELFLKRMRTIHQKGEEALADYRKRQQGRTDELITVLHDLLTAMQQETSAKDRLADMSAVVGDQSDAMIADCLTHMAYANNNYYALLWRFYTSHRQTLFELLDQVHLRSTSQDTTVEDALAFLRTHRTSKRDWLDLSATSLDLSWIADKWWKMVTGTTVRMPTSPTVNRRHFEICVFSQVMAELKSADLSIEGSEQFADYREQLISWEEYHQTVAAYGKQVGLPVESAAFVSEMRTWLEKMAIMTDDAFPTNASVRLVDGEAVLRRLPKRPIPDDLKKVDQLIAERIEPVTVLDVLADTDNWLHWTHFFGLSGRDARIEEARARYVATTFCYGCNLGPTQTAQSLGIVDRRQLAWIDQRHITEDKLDAAITALINAYNQFSLPKFWGSGKSASADGMKWDIYEQNLLAEYHIRYGGYGGIGYYHVADTYVALFSHFIPCGVWEAVYILDGLLKNTSDIQPDTLHADTQGQNTPVFGLAHLLGINLMPRIRNWKDLKLFRPSRDTHYKHIDGLFAEAIDWHLIYTHLPDMLRVVLSIQAGRITASTILRKLGNYSRKNRLYQAFRELGRVVRTVFLLQYVSDGELRQTIQAATNKSEAFNRFVQWLFFGEEGMITSNDRAKQRKRIKYNHLIANCLIFHNVHAQTRILHELAQEGYTFDKAVFERMSPYLRGHVNRFGSYALDFDRQVPVPDYSMRVWALVT